MKNKKLGKLTKSFIEHLKTYEQKEILKFLLLNTINAESPHIYLEVKIQNSIIDGLNISTEDFIEALLKINSTPLKIRRKKDGFVDNIFFLISQIVFGESADNNKKNNLYIFINENFAFYLALENQDKSLKEIFLESIELSFH